MKKNFTSNFETISPSALYLLITKAFTTIPFAKESSKIILDGRDPQIVKEKFDSIGFKLRCIHFEDRYRSIDEALSLLGFKNILEFSSGFSFRGLDWCRDSDIFYIDTDLSNILETKTKIIQELNNNYCSYPIDNLILKELNVLDRNSFLRIMELFPPGPIAIVNEGLLMYLDREQKRTLCKNIHEILSSVGGYWITADIYQKKDEHSAFNIDIFNDQGKKFLNKHKASEHIFDTFESAEEFFKMNGLKIHKKIEVPPSKISSRSFLRDIPRNILLELKDRQKRRETWILEVEN